MAYRRDLPTGVEGVDAVQKRGVDVYVRQRIKEIRMLEHIGDRFLGIAGLVHRSAHLSHCDATRHRQHGLNDDSELVQGELIQVWTQCA